MTTSPPSTTPRPLSDLQPDSDLLHLLFHRNKNQHRSAKWWKWFGMLRRNIRKLLHPEEGEVGDIGKRVEYMRRVLVPSCYSAFTSVIADTQFAPLGLALLGVLARVHAIVGPEAPAPKAKKEKQKEKEVVEVVVRETAGYRKKETMTELGNGGEDFGEAIVRREELVEEEEEEEEIVIEKKAVVVEEEEDTGIQEAEEEVSEHETPAIPRPSTKPIVEPDIVVATTKGPKRDEKSAKKKKKGAKLATSSRVHSSPPPAREERQEEKKAKRKAEEKEGAKKKKRRKKADAIDDLFAGLL